MRFIDREKMSPLEYFYDRLERKLDKRISRMKWENEVDRIKTKIIKEANMKDKELPSGLFRAEDRRIFLIRCPKCKAENYAPAVASGVCVWCGFDANKDCNSHMIIKDQDGK